MLFSGLFDDYLNDHRVYSEFTQAKKDVMLQNSTEVLSALIRDEKEILIKQRNSNVNT